MERINIGFDAKRAFNNNTGLGNYSRYFLSSLQELYSNEFNISAYTPKINDRYNLFDKNVTPSFPSGFNQKIKPIWRSKTIAKDLVKDGIQIFHGLSHEIPFGLPKSIKKVVTIHDLIFLRYPELYKPIDRNIYNFKFKYACKNADLIIAISEQTKQDIIHFYNIPEDKIIVHYQDCNPLFKKEFSSEELAKTAKKLSLPEKFLLCVGTIETRKNQLNIVKALHQNKIKTPLVLIGRKTAYAQKIETYVSINKMENQVIFLSNISQEDLVKTFQLATLFVYPSIFEGFGIPILEALNANTPVITSTGSCFSEVGGNDSIYVDPENVTALGLAIESVLNSKETRTKMSQSGKERCSKFLAANTFPPIVEQYKKILNS